MKKLLLLFFCMILLSTCKKYPEGGFLKQGPKTLITDKQGYWHVGLYEVNGIDSTSLIFSGINISDVAFSFSSYKDAGEKKFHSNLFQNRYENMFLNKNKTITFFDGSNNKSFLCDSTNGIKICGRNIFCPEVDATVWKIIKLRDKECILTYSEKNNYKIILKR